MAEDFQGNFMVERTRQPFAQQAVRCGNHVGGGGLNPSITLPERKGTLLKANKLIFLFFNPMLKKSSQKKWQKVQILILR
jgi:hypothetical protein